MKLRMLNQAGIERFSAYLDALLVNPSLGSPVDILEDDSLTSHIDPSVIIDLRTFRDRMELARYLDSVLCGITGFDLPRATGLWTWLTLLYFDQVCPSDKAGGRHPGVQRATWIPLADVTRRFYRHALLGPYLAFRAHRDKPERAAILLADPLHVMTSEGFRLFIETPFVNMPAPMEVATRFYYDPVKRRLRRGAGTKGPGGVRRLLAILQQLEVTYDIHQLSPDGLRALLPKEFEKWAPTP